MNITSRNSKTLRDDVAYNLIHADYLIRDALTLLKIAAGHLSEDIKIGVGGPIENTKLRAIETAINYASIFQDNEQ